jgi:hypothetical protein
MVRFKVGQINLNLVPVLGAETNEEEELESRY